MGYVGVGRVSEQGARETWNTESIKVCGVDGVLENVILEQGYDDGLVVEAEVGFLGKSIVGGCQDL